MAAVASTAQAAPQTGEIADGELVRRVRRGDDRAFEQLYHRYHRRITAYIHGMVHDHARAEDVAQDVFVSALRRMRETDRPIAFKPWVYEIAKNACIDQFRRSRRAEEVSYDADEGLGAADYGRLTSKEAIPESELESKQSLDHLRGAFGGLSETHHEILVMRELEGLSYREIGERLGMSRPSVESTLFRARRRLTEEYEELVSGARCQRIQSIIGAAAEVAPGARDQRRLARHVSHCQPCRRQARLAGLDIPVTPDRPVRQRIAAMLPLPLFLRKRWLGEGTDMTAVGSPHLQGFAQWSGQLGTTVDPSWFKAVATAATVAVAGAGAGLAGSTSAPGSVGSFASVLPSLDGGATEHRSIAGLRPTVSSALLTSADASASDAVQAAAPGAAASTETTAAAPASGTSRDAAADVTTQAADGSAALEGVVEQAATGLSAGGTASSGSGTTAPNTDAATSGSTEFPSGSADSPELALPERTTVAPEVAPPSGDGQATPAINAGTPDAPDLADGTAPAAPDAPDVGGAATGSLTGG